MIQTQRIHQPQPASASKNIFIFFISLEILIILIPVFVFGFTLEALQTITRFSGRLSLIFFILIISLKHRDFDSSFWLSRQPYLLFAILHGIHLVELLLYVSQANITLIPLRLAGGFVAYILIFLMPMFSAWKDSARISAISFWRWEVLFSVYVWLIFFMAYLPRVMGKLPNAGGNFWEHVLFFMLVICSGGYSLFSHLKFKTNPVQ